MQFTLTVNVPWNSAAPSSSSLDEMTSASVEDNLSQIMTENKNCSNIVVILLMHETEKE